MLVFPPPMDTWPWSALEPITMQEKGILGMFWNPSNFCGLPYAVLGILTVFWRSWKGQMTISHTPLTDTVMWDVFFTSCGWLAEVFPGVYVSFLPAGYLGVQQRVLWALICCFFLFCTFMSWISCNNVFILLTRSLVCDMVSNHLCKGELGKIKV